MKIAILFFLSLLLFSIAHAQKPVKQLAPYGNKALITIDSCIVPYTFNNESYGVSFHAGAKGLQQYFKSKVPLKNLSNVKGKIVAEVLIHPDGRACCIKLERYTGIFSVKRMDAIGLDRYINAMPKWTIKSPVVLEGKVMGYLLRLAFVLDGTGGIKAKYVPFEELEIINVTTEGGIDNN